MKILLSGSSGFLGSILSGALIAKGHQCIPLKREDEARVDITRPFSLDPTTTCDAVIHCAGKAHVVPKTKKEEQAFYQVNFEGTKYLCKALERLPQMPGSFVFISTVAVYGKERGGVLISEDNPLEGRSPYAKSKIMAEQWLRDWADHHQVILGILRLPLLAGPNPPGNLGTMIQGIRTGRYLSIGKADVRKSILWTEDIASIIPQLSKMGGIYNLTDGYHPCFGELEKAIANVLNKNPPMKVSEFIAKLLGLGGGFDWKPFSC